MERRWKDDGGRGKVVAVRIIHNFRANFTNVEYCLFPMIIPLVIWSFWFVSEILLNRLMRSDDRTGVRDRGSIRVIWITIGTANTLGILSAIFVNIPISHWRWVQVPGLALIVIGMVVRFTAILSLGRFFTVDVAIRKDHQLKQDGIYRWVRHPSYLGSMLSFLGFGLSLNNWISLPVIFFPILWAMILRIRIEERVLLGTFGEAYASYLKRTWRLLPGIY
jgi:protein-S-isoprenylcysteine O-methyltransferase Ste14